MGTKPDVVVLLLEPQRRIGVDITQHMNVNARDRQPKPSLMPTKSSHYLVCLLSELHE
jgi:hypothetical protein